MLTRRALLFVFFWGLVSLSLGCEPKPSECLQDADCGTARQCVQGQCKGTNDSCRPGDTRACYTGPKETRSKGICRDGTQTCSANGKWETTCTGEITPKAEICDKLDNNCNGQVDDVTAVPETCNGIDDNCDGKIDEALSQTCYTGPKGTEGKGPCKSGTQTCSAGKWGPCQGQVTPQTEICNNNKDDDCDGKIDNTEIGQPCTDPSKQGACQAGKWTCDSHNKKVCKSTAPSKPETCNGKDDDCDGKIDNKAGSSEPLSQPCAYTGPAGTAGKGICKPGVKACNNGTWSTTCTGQITPKAETCNNTDDDCDGKIDEGLSQTCYTGPKGTEGKGPCKSGTQTCSAGKWGTCQGQVTPQTERCENGVDDDCNGKIDDVPNLGAPCLDRTRKGACQQGIYRCQGQQRVCVQITQPTAEECDGIDNDCDGKIDNVKGSTKLLSRACYTGPANTRKKGACKDGIQRCILGRWEAQCTNQVRPSFELCNGKDDDCDGKTDEGDACAACTSGSTRPCFDGPQDARNRGRCQDGSETCTNQKWSGQCTASIPPRAEICNGQDDDCDGINDNQPGTRDPLRQPCYTGPANTKDQGMCQQGFQLCTQGQWSNCIGQYIPQKEICDKKDNDCDGQIDEAPACEGTARQLGETCSPAPGSATALLCAKGLLCIQSEERDPAAFCYQPCKTKTDCEKNQDGRTECAMISKDIGICISRADDGASCDIEQGRMCKPGLFCDMNIRRCRKPSESPTLGICGGRSGRVCDPNHVCVPQTPGVSHGYCLKRCKSNADCPSAICTYFTKTDAACAPLGTRKLDQTCGRADYGNKLDTTRTCAKGLFCARFDNLNPDGVCLTATTNCNTCTSQGRYCAVLGNGSIRVCAKRCGTCPTGTQCTPIAPATQVCTAQPPNGSVPFGGLCGPQRLCKRGLTCISSDPKKFNGFCSKIGCSTASDCPSTPPGATCKAVAPGAKLCIFPCQTNHQCPTGLVCSTKLQACIAL